MIEYRRNSGRIYAAFLVFLFVVGFVGYVVIP